MDSLMDLEGKNVLICTVTKYYTGHVVQETKEWLKLESAAWIPDTGRFFNALKSSTFSEVEPYPNPVFVMKGGSVDITEISKLPTKQE